MDEIRYKRCDNKDELEQILSIQKRNLRSGLSQQEMNIEGFVTVSHEIELLNQMNHTCSHMIAKSGPHVAGYALCMHPRYSNEIPVLKPMFKKVDSLLESEIKFMVMGQICIDKPFRRRGIFSGLYSFMRDQLKTDYDLIITEVDSGNVRSLGAHYKVGFKDLLVYQSGERTWHLIQWSL